MTAFLGTFNPGYAPYPKHEFGNASALGLASFALSAFVLGLYYAGAKGISTPNVIVSLAVFYGGLAEFLAGVWEFSMGIRLLLRCFVVMVHFGLRLDV